MRTEMTSIYSAVVDMGNFASIMLVESLDALCKIDRLTADVVVQKTPSLTIIYHNLEDEMFRFIALYQPIAKDMRKMVCSIRIIYNFECIGRMGNDIAKIVINLPVDNPEYPLCNIPDMGKTVIEMIADSIAAYQKEQIDLIFEINRRDDTVDALYAVFMKETIRWMTQNPVMIPVGETYLVIARLLERCGDQACNIAEMVRYMISGERLVIT